MGRSKQAQAEREQSRRYREHPFGVQWTVLLTPDEADIILEAAGEQDPGTFLKELALASLQYPLVTVTGSIADLGVGRSKNRPLDCDVDERDDLAEPDERDDLGLAAGPDTRDPFLSELNVVVVRQCEGGRFAAFRGLGGRTLQIQGTWADRFEAAAAAVAALDEAREQAGLPAFGDVIPIRYPDPFQKSWDAGETWVLRSQLPPAQFGQNARARRQARRAESKR